MDGMERRVASARGQRFRLDHFDDLRFLRIGLGVYDMDTRRVDPRHDQVAAFDVRMRRVRAKARTTGVPSEVVQFIAYVGHVQLAHQSAVSVRLWVDVDYT